MNALQILREARERLRKGWITGTLRGVENGELRCCALGALCDDTQWVVVEDDYKVTSAEGAKAIAMLAAIVSTWAPELAGARPPTDTVFVFNDISGRADVLALFDEAIRRLEAVEATVVAEVPAKTPELVLV